MTASRMSMLLPNEVRFYRGPKIVRWVTIAYLVVIMIRSLVHLFAPDGGAESIATVDTSVVGGENIIAMFGQWGAIQVLLASVLGLLVLRYPGFTPLVLLVLLTEPLLRALAAALKPLETTGTAPGASLNWVVVPLLLVLLIVSLCRVKN